MILVAPAIVAPLTSPKKNKENDQQDGSNSDNLKNPVSNLVGIVLKFSRFIAQTFTHLLKGMVNMVNSLYKKALSAFLRSPIAVTLPLRIKGWDQALVEFTAEMLASSVPESNPPLTERLKEISCPGTSTKAFCRGVETWNKETFMKRVDWLNRFLELIWPYFDKFIGFW